jgi:hypothetical protein
MTPKPKYLPIALGLIDEGRLVANANADLTDMQARLLRYVETYGEEAAKAKAKLTIEIILCVENPKEETVSIKAVTKVALPGRPATATMAFANTKDDGTVSLFVRSSGSDDVTPRQGKLCTDDGRMIDAATGELLDDAVDDAI